MTLISSPKRPRILFILFVCALFAPAFAAESPADTAVATPAIQLPAIFQDHLVLQHSTSAPLWGTAAPNQKITVAPSWPNASVVSTTADDAGRWRLTLHTPQPGGPYTITIATDDASLTLKDILLGEVWICSGQSNMQWALRDTDNAQAAIADADLPNLRLFSVKREFATTPQSDCHATWQVCSPDTVPEFSAAGFFFGRELLQKLDRPVGLLFTAWGGTPAQAWTSPTALSDFPPYNSMVNLLQHPDQLEQALAPAFDEYHKKLAQWELRIDALDPGAEQRWFSPQFDDSQWSTMTMPSYWKGTDLESVSNGIVWFRRVTNLPPSWARQNLELHFPAIDDIDTVWVNGVRLGTTVGWNIPRTYRVPSAALKVGPNVIAVRIINTGGEGGFGGVEEDFGIGPIGASGKQLARVAGEWKYKLSLNSSVPAPPTEPQLNPNQNSPSTLFNAMLAPLIPYRVAGAIWYQGESNAGRPLEYLPLFTNMIQDWRNHFESGPFPFYYVQIAPFAYTDRQSQYLRDAQRLALDKLTNLGMAVTLDAGVQFDIHPRDKITVGHRLALWALAKTYGFENLTCSGPLYRDMKIEGNRIRLFFDHVDGGLVAAPTGLADFIIAGTDQTFHPATATIEGDTVLVSSPEVSDPRAVRYAWANWVEASLFNAEKLPASSFRTDDWPTISDQPYAWEKLLQN